jgi:hypothetical protein
VFDVIGQLLQLNDIHFEELIREATYTKASEHEVLEQLERIDPKRLENLEAATGIALSKNVDLSKIRRTKNQEYRSEEQRLMPRYIEEFFKRACDFLGVNLETRADGLWRVPYVKEEYRSNNLEAVRVLGTVEKNYSKLTFYKEHLEQNSHSDAKLLSPGHPLFAAIAERLDHQLDAAIRSQSAVFIDADTDLPYRIHFLEVQIEGQQKGKDLVLRAGLCAVSEYAISGQDGQFTLISPDCLHDLAPARLDDLEDLEIPIVPPTPQEQEYLNDWAKVKVQMPMMKQEQASRQRELDIRQDYLTKAMEAAIRAEQTKQMRLAGKVAAGDETFRVARDSAQKRVRDLQERYQTKQKELDYLKIVRLGRVVYLGTALVHPAAIATVASHPDMKNDPEVEALAMDYVMNYERDRGWFPEDISNNHDGSGFDIRSEGAVDPETNVAPVRRIEVKGRSRSAQGISLTANEWRKAQQLGDSYWLYVVWGCKTEQPQLLTIQNPAKVLAGDVLEVKQVTRYVIGAAAIARCAIT